MATQPREFLKDGYRVEIIGPAKRCQVWVNGSPVLGLHYFGSLRAARTAAFGPQGWTKRHPIAKVDVNSALVAALKRALDAGIGSDGQLPSPADEARAALAKATK